MNVAQEVQLDSNPLPHDNLDMVGLSNTEELVVKQVKEWTEILTDWETKNRYTIHSEGGEQLFMAGEVGSGVGDALWRAFLKNARPFSMEVRDAKGGLFMKLKRPWTFFFSRLEVYDAGGTVVGMLRQRFAILKRRFTVEGSTGEAIAEIEGPFFRPWTFHILRGGQKEGKISKKWSGALKEMFTDADTFGVSFGASWDEALRKLALAATFLIDFVYFEDKD